MDTCRVYLDSVCIQLHWLQGAEASLHNQTTQAGLILLLDKCPRGIDMLANGIASSSIIPGVVVHSSVILLLYPSSRWHYPGTENHRSKLRWHCLLMQQQGWPKGQWHLCLPDSDLDPSMACWVPQTLNMDSWPHRLSLCSHWWWLTGQHPKLSLSRSATNKDFSFSFVICQAKLTSHCPYLLIINV